jgi:hypothetical protein
VKEAGRAAERRAPCRISIEDRSPLSMRVSRQGRALTLRSREAKDHARVAAAALFAPAAEMSLNLGSASKRAVARGG